MRVPTESLNIFSCLAKGNPARENFLSQAFLFLVRKLLESEKKESQEFAKELLGKICNLDFFAEKNIWLTTEEKITTGRLDIKIETSSKLIYLENKVDAGFGNLQLERYKEDLDKQQKNVKKIILITKYVVDNESKKIANVAWLWYKVYDIIENLKKKYIKDSPKTDIDLFFVDHLSAYIKEERMTIKKVSSVFTEGIKSMLNLIEQIRFVLGEKDCKITARSAGEKFNGFYFKVSEDSSVQDWIGIFYYDNYRKPSQDQMVFELKELEIPRDAVSKCNFHIEFDKKRFSEPSLILSFEDCNFFTFEKDKQLDILREFLQEGMNLIKEYRYSDK